ncbi:MAG: TolC family protein, partial [Robiginitomaculum sp.]|nr:TolC family protein [Robiginitomaculum sp.]
MPPPEMVDRALDNYPIYQQATQNIETSRAQADSLRMGPHELTLGGSYTRRQIGGLGNFGEYDATLSRGLRIRGKARLDREAGQIGVALAENIAEDARHQTALLLK